MTEETEHNRAEESTSPASASTSRRDSRSGSGLLLIASPCQLVRVYSSHDRRKRWDADTLQALESQLVPISQLPTTILLRLEKTPHFTQPTRSIEALLEATWNRRWLTRQHNWQKRATKLGRLEATAGPDSFCSSRAGRHCSCSRLPGNDFISSPPQ
jgi:hypothetical protein